MRAKINQEKIMRLDYPNFMAENKMEVGNINETDSDFDPGYSEFQPHFRNGNSMLLLC